MYETHTNTTYELRNYDEDIIHNLNEFELDLFDQNYRIIKDDYYNNNDELHSTVFKDGVKYCEITHYHSHLFEFCVKYFKNNQLFKEEWYMLDKLSSVTVYDENENSISKINLSPYETKEVTEYNYQNNETYLLRDEEVEMYLL
ncbi:hypothetical protein CPG37_10790 [Malaciobacter canalis]|uniref:Uncharacterized protein n=1 Tax=Malaciobacter canalis TaxID=1912871 RepID=A0ABX4LMJ1_9BACT|nr:hypothetical protein [Malaciobacter canalis]PHO09076.1 hypothetical protein CPG37_10790 [Malaciobacter canalis]QEE31820.1 hypothetical protein ACAN_0309 [Malaciobacter canalis]